MYNDGICRLLIASSFTQSLHARLGRLKQFVANPWNPPVLTIGNIRYDASEHKPRPPWICAVVIIPETHMNRLPFQARYLWLSAGAIATAVLVACGGGGESSPAGGETGSAQTATSSGPITGFGSIIVNGVRIDNSAAQITLDDDDSGKDADLKLGMMVEVEADIDSSGNPSRANLISTRSLVQGPISAITAGNNQLLVLGVSVTVTASTVFDGPGVGGLASLSVGEGIEVHGLIDAAGNIKASRIERKPAATTDIRMTGIVESAGSSSLTINGAKVSIQSANLINLSEGITPGMLVRVKGTLSGSDIVASKIRQFRPGPTLRENQRIEVEGVVTKFTSATNFEVNGVPVSVPEGTIVQGVVANGARVEVKGRVTNNVLVASKVDVENEGIEQDDAREVHGRITALDMAGKFFTVRDGALTVKWNSATNFDSSSLSTGAAGLTTGLRVEVKGRIEGNALLATRIEIDK
jgi:hypothetical protein